MDAEEKRAETERMLRTKQSRNPLEPLLMQLARDFSDDGDLSNRLRRLYKASGCELPRWVESEHWCWLGSVCVWVWERSIAISPLPCLPLRLLFHTLSLPPFMWVHCGTDAERWGGDGGGQKGAGGDEGDIFIFCAQNLSDFFCLVGFILFVFVCAREREREWEMIPAAYGPERRWGPW